MGVIGTLAANIKPTNNEDNSDIFNNNFDDNCFWTN